MDICPPGHTYFDDGTDDELTNFELWGFGLLSAGILVPAVRAIEGLFDGEVLQHVRPGTTANN